MRRLLPIILTAFLGLALVPKTASAQTTEAQVSSQSHQFVFHFGPQFPVGSLGDRYDSRVSIDKGYSFPVGLGYYYRPNTFLSVGAYIGHHQFTGATGNPNEQDLLPLNLAVRGDFSLLGFHPYVGVKGGPFVVINSESDNSTEVGVEPELGVLLPLSPRIGLDINVGYTALFGDETRTYLDTNVGVAVTL